MRSRLVLLVLIILLALVLGFWTFTPPQAVNLVLRGGYWLLLLVTGLFLWQLCLSLRDSQPFWKNVGWWKHAAFIVATTFLLHVQERHEFKIVADEVVLSSTARQMHFHREAAVVVRGFEYAGNFTPLNAFLDKRPLFFPFLLAMVHDLTGYRVANVFVLNAALSFVLVALVYAIARRLGGSWSGVSAVLLLCTIPLVEQNATGGGFEILNLVMLLLTLWLGLRLSDGYSDAGLSAFVLSGVLLAQVRYESVLFVLPVAVVVALTWWWRREVRLPASLLASPLFLIIYPLQHNVFKISESSWQMFSVAGAETPFALRYFYENVAHALNFFFTFDGSQPNSWLVALFGILSTGLVVLVLYKEHQTLFSAGKSVATMLTFLIGLMLHTVLMLCYFWGKWDDPVIRRLSLPTHLLLIFSTIFVWPRLIPSPRRWPILSGLAGIYLFGFALPASSMHRFTQENFAARTTNWLGDYIRRNLEGRRVIAIDDSAGLQWFLYGQSSITPERFADKWEDFVYHFKRRSFDDYLVVQRVGVDLRTGHRFVSWGDDLGSGVTIELIEEKAFAPRYIVRLSRITEIDDGKFKEWVEARKKTKTPGSTTMAFSTVDIADPDQLAEWIRRLP